MSKNRNEERTVLTVENIEIIEELKKKVEELDKENNALNDELNKKTEELINIIKERKEAFIERDKALKDREELLRDIRIVINRVNELEKEVGVRNRCLDLMRLIETPKPKRFGREFLEDALSELKWRMEIKKENPINLSKFDEKRPTEPTNEEIKEGDECCGHCGCDSKTDN